MKKILLIGSAGYIGSYLVTRLAHNYDVTGVDKKDGLFDHDNFDFIKSAYQDLDVGFFKQFDHILYFAGISSVPMANQDPENTIKENLFDLYELSKKCKQSHVIYASSGSVYANLQSADSLSFTATENIHNAYDASKLALDLVIDFGGSNYNALRLGTVSGWSPNLRKELIFNSMCISAIENGVVNISSPNTYRSILFLDDLYNIVNLIMTKTTPIKKIPCLSYSGTIGQIGQEIASFFDAKLNISKEVTTGYSFVLKNILDDFSPHSSLKAQCAEFRENYEK